MDYQVPETPNERHLRRCSVKYDAVTNSNKEHWQKLRRVAAIRRKHSAPGKIQLDAKDWDNTAWPSPLFGM